MRSINYAFAKPGDSVDLKNGLNGGMITSCAADSNGKNSVMFLFVKKPLYIFVHCLNKAGIAKGFLRLLQKQDYESLCPVGDTCAVPPTGERWGLDCPGNFLCGSCVVSFCI